MSETEKKQSDTVTELKNIQAAREKEQNNLPDPTPVPYAPGSEWSERQQWEAKTSLKIRADYEQLLSLWKEEELVKVRKEYDGVVEVGLKKMFDEWKAEQKPPTHEEVQELLGQEYETFSLPIVSVNGDGQEDHKTFTIRELPQSAEKKFYKQFKEKLLSKVSMLSAFDQENMDATFESKAKAMLEVIDDGFDVLADAVVIVLNPFGKGDINREWVQLNIGSDRQWRIVEAQLKVNRLKDFFSRVSQSGQSMSTTMTGQSFQRLQQLARS